MENQELLLISGTALAAAALVGGLARRRRKSPEEKESERRLQLHARGRLTEGSLARLIEGDGARLLCYQYAVAGVTYQAVQDISALRHGARLDGVCEGLPARIKYDPQNPSDSIVVGELWNGLQEGSQGGAGGAVRSSHL